MPGGDEAAPVMSAARLELPEQGLIAPEKPLLQSRPSALPGNAMTDAFTTAPSSHLWSTAPGSGVTSGLADIYSWSAFHGRMDDAFHAGAPFVYAPAGESGQEGSWRTPDDSPVPAAVSDAAHDVFDGWINTLASWTQAGTATIGQQGDPIENAMLVANGDPLATGGGWR